MMLCILSRNKSASLILFCNTPDHRNGKNGLSISKTLYNQHVER